MAWLKRLILISGSFSLGFGTSQFSSAAASSREVHALTIAIAKQYEQEHRTEQSMIAAYRQQSWELAQLIAAARSKH